AAEFRAHVQVLQVQAGLAQEGGEGNEEQGEPGGLAVAFGDHHLRRRARAEQGASRSAAVPTASWARRSYSASSRTSDRISGISAGVAGRRDRGLMRRREWIRCWNRQL